MRKAFLLLLFAAALLPAFFSSAQAEAFSLYFLPANSAATETAGKQPCNAVSVYRINDQRYLFLPAGWDSSSLSVHFTGASQVTLDGKACRNGDAVALRPGGKVSVKIKGGGSFTLRVMQSERIPAVFVTTASGNLNAIKADKTAREAGQCTIVNADGSSEYSGELTYIRTRGNASFFYPKKSFQIKLKTATPLFGMKADRKWVLLANYLDKSLLRNTLAYAVARYANVYSFVPGTQPVDLYVNHQYYGSFLLTEKCEIDPDRLDIDSLEKRSEQANAAPLESFPSFGNRLYALNARKGFQIANDPQDITGGYLILANSRVYYAGEKSGFVTSRGQAFSFDEPKYASERQTKYVSALFQQIEDALFSKTGNDPATGKHWSKLLDKTTFVHRYLLAEVLADFDGQKPYFYKNTDAKDPMIYCAPVWDQDNILGANEKYNKAQRFYICNDQSLPYLWFPQAMKHSDFKKEAMKLYRSVYAPALRILLGRESDPEGRILTLDQYAAEIQASAAMDNVRWPISKNRATNFNMKTGGDQAANVKYLRNFLEKRLAFLDKQWGK